MNKKSLNKIDLKISLVFMLIGGLSGLLTALYQLPSIDPSMIAPLSKEAFIPIVAIQVAILYGFILSFLGLKLSRATNLNKGLLQSIYNREKYKFDSIGIKLAIGFGFINALVITASEKFIFMNLIPELGATISSFSPLYLLAAIFYGGIIEEIMLRLFLMSLLVFILYKLFARNKAKEDIPKSFYYIAIVVAAVLFGIGHLPAAFMLFNVTPVVILRVVFLNAFAGILFGYLYYKKGLEYAMISHIFSHLFMQLLFIPILF